MSNTTNFSCRMDKDVKEKCEYLYNELGLNLTTAINVFLKESIRAGGFPFDVKLNIPNDTTLEAMLEAKKLAKDSSVEKYTNVQDALDELKK